MSGAPASGSSIFANYSWSLLNIALSKGLRFFGIVLCIRQIGIESWGQVASALAVVAFLAFAVDQGLSGTPQVFRVGERALDRPLIGIITRYRLMMAAGLIALLWACRAVSPAPSFLVACYAFTLLPRALSIDWLFHRRERFHLTLLINAARMAVFFLGVVFLVDPGSSPLLVIGIEMAAEAVGVAFSYALIGRLNLERSSGPAPDLPIMTLLVFAFPVLINGLMDTALAQADILVLKQLRGYEETGQYDIGGKIGMSYFFLGATLVQIVLPKLARLHGAGDPERMKAILRAAAKILMLLGTALMIPSFYYSKELVPLLFNHDYPLTRFVFEWIPIWVYAAPLSMLNIVLLLAIGRRKDYLWGSVMGACIYVGANFAFISAVGGKGAVYARFVAEGFLLLYSLSRLPADFRGVQVRAMAVYAGNLAVQVTLFRLHAALGHREIFLALALASLVAVALIQRTASRKTLETLVRN